MTARCSYTAKASDGSVLRCTKAAWKGHQTCRVHSRKAFGVGFRQEWDSAAGEFATVVRTNLPDAVRSRLKAKISADLGLAQSDWRRVDDDE